MKLRCLDANCAPTDPIGTFRRAVARNRPSILGRGLMGRRSASAGRVPKGFPAFFEGARGRGCVLRLGGCSLLLASAGGLLVRVRHESGCGGLCARATLYHRLTAAPAESVPADAFCQFGALRRGLVAVVKAALARLRARRCANPSDSCSTNCANCANARLSLAWRASTRSARRCP